jgi:hypothetical protein
MVTQLNKGIFGKMGNCSMIEKVYVPNVVIKTPSPSYGVSVDPVQYVTYVTQNKDGHGSQILCMVAKVFRLSSEEMRSVSLKRQKRQIETIRRLHRSCVHRSIKHLISLKR